MVKGRFFSKYYVTVIYSTVTEQKFVTQIFITIKKSGAKIVNERVIAQWKKDIKDMMERQKNITISEVLIDTFTQVY